MDGSVFGGILASAKVRFKRDKSRSLPIVLVILYFLERHVINRHTESRSKRFA
jgi:hypothetical protein